MTRRRFIASTAALAAGASVWANTTGSPACDEDYDFLFARVKFSCHDRRDDRWNKYPGSDRNVLDEIRRAMRCRVKLHDDCRNGMPRYGREDQFNAVLTLNDMATLRRYPFIFMTGEGPFPLSAQEEENLKEYLASGGFLFADDCVRGLDGDFFYQECCDRLRRLFGQNAVGPIPNDHELMHNVHDMRGIGLPQCLGVNRGPTGLFLGDRVAAFLSSTDLHCGCIVPGRRRVGRGGTHGYAEAVAMVINIAAYSMSH